MNAVSMNDIISRLRERRSALELSFQDLAVLTGMSKSTLQRYESGAIKNIPLSRVEDLASALQTTPEYLMGWNDDPYDYDKDEDNRIDSIPSDMLSGLQETYGNDLSTIWKAYQSIEDEAQQESHKAFPKNIIPIPKSHLIPVIGTIACGTPILAKENIEDYEPCPDYVSADFALHCKGDSMINARINDGDTVFIHKQPEVENGEIAVVEVFDGEGCDECCEATLKRFYRHGNTVTLNAENPKYPPFVFVGEEINNIKIIGKAVSFLSKIE